MSKKQKDLLRRASEHEQKASELRMLAEGKFIVDDICVASVEGGELHVYDRIPKAEMLRFSRWIKRVHDTDIGSELLEKSEDDDEWSDD